MKKKRSEAVQKLRETLRFAFDLVKVGLVTWQQLQSIFAQILGRPSLPLNEDIIDASPQRLSRLLERYEELSAALDKILKDYTIHIVPHSHVDLSWRWDYAEAQRRLTSIFGRALELMEKHPSLTFCQDQSAAYHFLEGTHVLERIKQHVKTGRWDANGGMFTEPDAYTPCGESFVRQLLYGKRWFKTQLGVDVKVGCNLDPFAGHTWTLPQMLKKSGIDYYVLTRGVSEEVTDFWWEGPNGSRVLCYHLVPHYNSGHHADPERVRTNFLRLAPLSTHKECMLFDGLDCNFLSPKDVENFEKLREEKPFPKLKYSTTLDFMKSLARCKQDRPVIGTELLYETKHSKIHGSYTTHGDVKKLNRDCENALVTAEKWSAVASELGVSYPKESFVRAWKNVLLNQMHDILPGTCAAPVYDGVLKRYHEALSIASDAAQRSLSTIAGCANNLTARRSRNAQLTARRWAVAVFNPLSWERTDWAECRFTVPGELKYVESVTDANGRAVPWQVLEKTDWTAYQGLDASAVVNYGVSWRIGFIASEVPSMGYKVFHVTFTDKEPKKSFSSAELKADKKGTRLENGFLKISLDPNSGCIASLFDKNTGQEIVPRGNRMNEILVYQDMGDPWNISYGKGPRTPQGKAKIELVELGPARISLKVGRRFKNSWIENYLTLYSGVPRLDIRSQIEWHEPTTLVKVAFPTRIKGKTFSEIPYGVIEREGRHEWPAQQWVDVSDGHTGLAILNNGRYGHDISPDGTLRLTLLRNVQSHWAGGPTDDGLHELTYSLLPHRGDWREGEVFRAGYELNNPLQVSVDLPHDEQHLRPSAKSDGHVSFVRVKPSNVLLTALKKHEDSDGLILRLVEHAGRKSRATVEMFKPVKRAAEIDMIEWHKLRKLSARGGTFQVTLGPWEIKTVLVEL